MEPIDLVLAVDIGGTTTSLGLLDRAGADLGQATLATEGHRPAADLVARIAARADVLRDRLDQPHRLRGVGVGAPNANGRRGTVDNPVNLDWGPRTDLAGLLQDALDLPTAVTNDANAAAMGEWLFGGARGLRDFITITLGTGLGSGIVAEGRLVEGADGLAGELGHTVLEVDGRLCGCGNRGCLEAYVSAPGLCRTVLALLAERGATGPLAAVPPRELTARRVFQAAMEGDPVALAAFDATARWLGRKLAEAVAHTRPEAIFLCGGLAAAGELLRAPAQDWLDRFLFPAYRGRVALRRSELPEAGSALLGAGALIWSRLEGQGGPA
jgi:glucokinase